MRRSNHSTSLDFELNLAPIIDCFTVLITFMLVSASYMSISLFDAGYAPSESTGDTNPPPVTVEIRVRSSGLHMLVTKGKTESKREFANSELATEAIKELKGMYPMVDTITLTADDDVKYELIVKTMEKIRLVFPSLILGGF